jgi:hypothetical protein
MPLSPKGHFNQHSPVTMKVGFCHVVTYGRERTGSCRCEPPREQNRLFMELTVNPAAVGGCGSVEVLPQLGEVTEVANCGLSLLCRCLSVCCMLDASLVFCKSV